MHLAIWKPRHFCSFLYFGIVLSLSHSLALNDITTLVYVGLLGWFYLKIIQLCYNNILRQIYTPDMGGGVNLIPDLMGNSDLELLIEKINGIGNDKFGVEVCYKKN